MQPVHAAMSARVASSMSGSAITSETANRPPGRSTRAASRSTCGLSAERLITQLEITTSTLASGERDVLEIALDELDVLHAGLGGVGARQLEHLVGHVEPDRLARRGDAPRGDQHVGTGAGAEVEHGLALAQLGDRGGHPATQRRGDRSLGHASSARRRRRAAPPNTPVARAAGALAAQRPSRSSPGLADGSRTPRCRGGRGVALAHGLADSVVSSAIADSSSRASGIT